MNFIIWSIIKPTIEICILWLAYYRILVFFEGTRAFQVLKGITILLVAFLASQIIGLNTINWLLTKFFAISIVALMIIFQQELRQGLARLGQHHMFNFALEESEIIAIIAELTSATYKLSKQKIGCLIAIEVEAKLNTYIESGVPIDSKISSELVQTIFTPKTPLHDGGIIIKGNRIVAASCLFPLSDNPNFNKIIGTRHRAALGITEQTDALVLMVSEETGEISVASEGRFIPIVNKERLTNILKNILVAKDTSKEKKNEKVPNK